MNLCQLGHDMQKRLEESHMFLLPQGETLQNKIVFILLPQLEDNVQKKLQMSCFINSNTVLSTNKVPCVSYCGETKGNKIFLLHKNPDLAAETTQK